MIHYSLCQTQLTVRSVHLKRKGYDEADCDGSYVPLFTLTSEILHKPVWFQVYSCECEKYHLWSIAADK